MGWKLVSKRVPINDKQSIIYQVKDDGQILTVIEYDPYILNCMYFQVTDVPT